MDTSMHRRAVLTALGGLACASGVTAGRGGRATSHAPGPAVSKGDASAVWPQHQYDAAHTGNAQSAGPKEEPAEKWRYSTNGNHGTESSPIVGDGAVFVGSGDYTIYAIELADGSERWTYDTGGAINSTGAYADGTLYMGGGGADEFIAAFDTATGEVQWRRPNVHPQGSSMTYADGRLYLTAGHTQCFDTDTGSLVWARQVDGHGSVAVADGVAFAPAGGSNRAYAFDAATGERRWMVEVDERLTEKCEPTVSGGVVVLGGSEGTLFALDVDDGSVRWKASIPTAVFSSPAVAGGRVFVGVGDESQNSQGGVYAFSLSDGSKEWDYGFAPGQRAFGSPVVADGVVYIGDVGPSLYGFDATTGRPLWTYQAELVVPSSVAVVDGSLVVFDHQGHVIRFVEPSGASRRTTDGRPHASFTVSNARPAVGETVEFDASDSRDDGGIVRYEWDLTHHESDAEFTLTHTGRVVHTAYDTAGRYVPILRVRDGDGNARTTTRSLQVGAAGSDEGGGSGGGDPRPRRGFLTNGREPDWLSALIDPFYLTVGGFVLSVFGIVHQMLRGK